MKTVHFGFKSFQEWKKGNKDRTPGLQPFNGGPRKETRRRATRTK